jgi:hypothetical protein
VASAASSPLVVAVDGQSVPRRRPLLRARTRGISLLPLTGYYQRMSFRRSISSATIGVLALVVPLMGYFCAYFLTGKFHSDTMGIVRVYKAEWQVKVFGSAARAESLVTGKDVELVTWAVPPQ